MVRMDFHIHSSYSDDSSLTVGEIVEFALQRRLQAVGIVDHVRMTAPWLAEREAEIRTLRARLGRRIDIFSGLEAKVLDSEGALNLSRGAAGSVDFVVGSIHGLPPNVLKGLQKSGPASLIGWWQDVISSLAQKEEVRVLGHPDRLLLDYEIRVPADTLADLTRVILSSHAFVEMNLPKAYATQPLLTTLIKTGARNIIFASDAHDMKGLRSAHEDVSAVCNRAVYAGNRRLRTVLAGKTSKKKHDPTISTSGP